MSGDLTMSGYALAVIRHVERCGGRLDYDALADEFIVRRGYYPEDFYGGLSEAREAGALLNLDGLIVREAE